MHPLGIIILIVLLYYVTAGSRRAAALAMVGGVLYLTQGQAIEMPGANLFAIRILGLALFVRVLARHEFSFIKLDRIDRAFLWLYGFTVTVFFLRSGFEGASTLAIALDATFCYFGFRGLFRTEEDLRWLLQMLVILLIPYAVLVAVERVQGRSFFIFLGGLTGGWEREGATRCMGSFRYPVSLGTFGASLLALYVGTWHSKLDRRYAIIGICLCAWLIFASNSGGSLSAAAAVVVGWVFWYIRKNMRLVRWTIVAMLVALAFAMKAPVWYIMTRGPFGGDSWHRAYVIDVAMRHIEKWWLVGMPMEDTAEWFPYTLAATGGADITNQYLGFGITAGLGAIALFVHLIARVFGRIGRAAAALMRQGSNSIFLVWGLGVMMLVHVVSWFGVTYFDQLYVIWFLELAAAVSITSSMLRAAESTRQAARAGTASFQGVTTSAVL